MPFCICTISGTRICHQLLPSLVLDFFFSSCCLPSYYIPPPQDLELLYEGSSLSINAISIAFSKIKRCVCGGE
jgi:hypothetical protein